MRTAVRGVLLAAVFVMGLPAAAQAAERPSPFPFHWGKIKSASGHSGYAQADAWVTAFNEKHFQTYGSLYDRDRHAGHCASVQAKFHYRRVGRAGRSRAGRRLGEEGIPLRVHPPDQVAGPQGVRLPVGRRLSHTLPDRAD